MKLYEELVWRGLIKDVAGEDLEDKLNNEKITFYWGTDPTADSLHLGHYSSLVTAKRLAKAGHHPILLVGGATGLIGDPRPTSEREIIPIEDIINRRLETGITYAEFSYTLMQGYDFLHLFREKNCILQAEGSDQWGNITTGVDLIRKVEGKEVYGFTMPLILDSTGKKFGKSEGNALWLDESKTSSYELYQYLINVDDSKVEEYLKVFTFLTPEEIMKIVEEHNKEPHLRLGQKALAKEIITDLHGIDSYNSAVKISEALFSGNIKELSETELKDAMSGVETFNVNEEKNIVDLLVDTGILSSKREAREFVSNGSISINDEKVNDLELLVKKDLTLYNKYIVIRRGKKKYYLVIMED